MSNNPEKINEDRLFWTQVRRALLIVVRAIEKRWGLTQK